MICVPADAICSRTNDGQQVAQFVLEVGGGANGLRHLLTHQFVKTLSQPVNGGFKGALGEAQLKRRFRIRRRWAVGGDKCFQAIIDFWSSVRDVARAQPRRGPFKQRERPLLVKDLFRSALDSQQSLVSFV